MNIACLITNTAVLKVVRTAFMQAGAECVHFTSEVVLFRALLRQKFDLIFIDLDVAPTPDDAIVSWLNCRAGNDTPVLAMSPVRDAHMTALVLNAGADDLLVRPFDAVELLARAHALVRRGNPRGARRRIELAGFSLDRESSKFAYLGTPIMLTSREFGLAWMFFSSPGVYISRETIGTSIWSSDSEVAGRTIEQHVYKLRKKLQLGAERGVSIRTAYGQGYRLELSGQQAGALPTGAEPGPDVPA
jgi:DNA-binding response OmpR family regulator